MKSPVNDKPRTVHFLYSCSALKGLPIGTFLLVILLSFATHALPENIENYEVLPGGLTDIQDGAYVEGSVRNRGIQPDYQIDLQSEPLKSLLVAAREIGLQNISYWDKIGLIVELMRTDFFKYHNYHNPYYRRLLKKYRLAKKDVPLSEYGVCGAGVCREHALVLHFALKAAGIDNKHAYAEIYRASNYHGYQIIEDHAFTVVKHEEVDWVVDAYYWGFNGFRLQDLLSSSGITEHSPHAPIAAPGPGTRWIVKINNFPKIYNPKFKASLCAGVFLH
ncbi:MAG TPA: hypothetical protein VIG33_09055 [Pseudobdellovibrionaceae bacterium]|jgi:hypothetical protein